MILTQGTVFWIHNLFLWYPMLKDKRKGNLAGVVVECLIVVCQCQESFSSRWVAGGLQVGCRWVAGGLDFSDIFNDNDKDDLPSGSGLKKRVRDDYGGLRRVQHEEKQWI